MDGSTALLRIDATSDKPLSSWKYDKEEIEDGKLKDFGYYFCSSRCKCLYLPYGQWGLNFAMFV